MHRIQRDTTTQAFHDMATHNVDDGTGGLDGSIVYELGRAEVCADIFLAAIMNDLRYLEFWPGL